MQGPVWLAAIQYDYARYLLARGDTPRAGELAGAALAQARSPCHAGAGGARRRIAGALQCRRSAGQHKADRAHGGRRARRGAFE